MLQVIILPIIIETNRFLAWLWIVIIIIFIFLQIKIAPKQTQTEQVDDVTAEEIEEIEIENINTNPFATVEELEQGKLPPEEILSLPMFKVPTFKYKWVNNILAKMSRFDTFAWLGRFGLCFIFNRSNTKY